MEANWTRMLFKAIRYGHRSLNGDRLQWTLNLRRIVSLHCSMQELPRVSAPAAGPLRPDADGGDGQDGGCQAGAGLPRHGGVRHRHRPPAAAAAVSSASTATATAGPAHLLLRRPECGHHVSAICYLSSENQVIYFINRERCLIIILKTYQPHLIISFR